jgi:Tfp pilus assembly protein PilP
VGKGKANKPNPDAFRKRKANTKPKGGGKIKPDAKRSNTFLRLFFLTKG